MAKSNVPKPTSPEPRPNKQIRLLHLLGAAALLAPASYVIGRFSAEGLLGAYFGIISPVVVATSLGMLLGIPLGIFFGSQHAQYVPSPIIHHHPTNILQQENQILGQIKQELNQILILFEPRRGDTSILSRLEYPIEYWNALKASGQLFVMSDASLMNTIARAYYWVEQASRLERMAFESRFSAVTVDNQNSSAHLIADARLLDGPLESSVKAAIAGIDQALAVAAGATNSAI